MKTLSFKAILRDYTRFSRPILKTFGNFSLKLKKGKITETFFSACGPDVREQIKLARHDNRFEL